MTKIFRQGVGVDNIVSAQSNADRSPSKPALRYRLCQVKLHKFSDLPPTAALRYRALAEVLKASVDECDRLFQIKLHQERAIALILQKKRSPPNKNYCPYREQAKSNTYR